MSRKGVKRVRWDTKIISGRVSIKMYDTVIDIVHTGHYVDVTDYLRTLIRKDIEERGLRVDKKMKTSPHSITPQCSSSPKT